jgi:PAS domain S-box-containing protein
LSQDSQPFSQQDLFRAIVETANEGIWVIDADGCTTYANQRMCDLLHCTTEDLMHRTFSDFLFPADVPAAIRLFEDRKKGISRQIEFRLRRKDGSEVWTVSTNNSLTDNSGAFIGAVALFLDITERRQAEDAAREAAFLVESSQLAIISWTAEGIRNWNASAQRLFGYSAAEIIGKPISILIPPSRKKEPRDILRKLNDGEILENFETEWVCKDRSHIDVGLTFSALKNNHGAIIGASGIVRDISQSKKAQQHIDALNRELRLRLAEMQTILDVAPVGIAIASDAACEKIRLNKCFTDYLRVSPNVHGAASAPKSKGTRGYRMFHKGKELASSMLPMRFAARTKRAVRNMDVEVVHDSGRTRNYLASAAPLVDDRGKVGGCVGLYLDITERKRSEDKIRKLNRELEQRAKSAVSLSLRVVEAQETERRRVARELHDGVNQILSAAKFHIQAIGERGSRSAASLHRDIQRTQTLLDRAIHETRRISQNLRPAVLDDLGLIAAARSTCAEFTERTRVRCIFKSIRFPRKHAAELGLTFYRIIQEALNNVERHSGATRTFIELGRTRKELKLIVRDNGQGFDITALQKTKTLGFGLYNIRERAAFLGGKVDLISKPGKGTTLVIRVPHTKKAKKRLK